MSHFVTLTMVIAVISIFKRSDIQTDRQTDRKIERQTE